MLTTYLPCWDGWGCEGWGFDCGITDGAVVGTLKMSFGVGDAGNTSKCTSLAYFAA